MLVREYLNVFFIVNNSSFIHDEILAHRLGLIPICVNPSLFEYENDGQSNEKNTIVFRLAVFLFFLYSNGLNDKVFSNALEWLQTGSEMSEETNCQFSIKQSYIKPSIQSVYNNILLAILAPGKEILLEAVSIKGFGKNHAKWSPVATAWYRLMSEIRFLQRNLSILLLIWSS